MNRPMQLERASLADLAADVRRPAYDRSRTSNRIVHIGVGGFFRAHQAAYLDDLLHQEADHEGTAAWGLCGVGLLAHDALIRDAMKAQDCLYSLVERSRAGDHCRVIGSVIDFLYAPDDPEAVIEAMASPDCRIVSLTITEGGYYMNQGTGEFDASHPDIVHDLAHPQAPRCSFGFLAAALDRRRCCGIAPFTAMSCDNLQNNGDILKKMLLEFTGRLNPALSRWIADHGAFPNSMVDRITPATTEADRNLVKERFGVDDAWPVITEPFRQWVLEDHFPQGRPAWERVGVQMTANVLPYEKIKLRLLNASHQAIAYIGMLCGYQYVDEAMADPNVRKLMNTMMDVEVSPLLDEVEGVDLARYKASLTERFSNPAIRDQLSRLGTEGSARIPKFVLPSILEQIERGGPLRLLSFTIASWFRFLTGTDERGALLPVNDPLAEKLRRLALEGRADPLGLLQVKELFGEVLPSSPVFVTAVRESLQDLYTLGARAALARAVGH